MKLYLQIISHYRGRVQGNLKKSSTIEVQSVTVRVPSKITTEEPLKISQLMEVP